MTAKLKNGWRISLLTNRGVYKQATKAPVVVPSERTVQTVIVPGKVDSVTERISGKKLPIRKQGRNNLVTVTITAGELAVMDFIVK